MIRRLLAFTALLLAASPAGAVLTIDITQGAAEPLPIAVVPFGWAGEGSPPLRVADVVSADLGRSGHFRLIDREAFLNEPDSPDAVRFKDWRLVGADALIIGRLAPADDGRVEVRFRLLDVYGQEQIKGVRFLARPDGLRHVAHRIADAVQEALLGYPGAFASRIAYVVKDDDGHRLVVADADGGKAQTIVTSEGSLMSPAWSPDGQSIAYVSFEQGRSMVYRQDLATGKRRTLAAFDGINSAPAFAPAGDRLALTLSRDGNPEIYIMDLETQRLERITRHGAIDTEPAWTPDGESLIFTSDRGGGPQLYRVAATGGPVERLTFEGAYNAAASVSPDGERVAFLHGDGSRFRIAVKPLDGTGGLRSLTPLGEHESPTFAPNGRKILYATRGGEGGGELAVVSVDGNIRKRLQRQGAGDVREPDWGSRADQ